MVRRSAAHKQLKWRIVLVRWFWLLLSGVIALFIPKFGDYLVSTVVAHCVCVGELRVWRPDMRVCASCLMCWCVRRG